MHNLGQDIEMIDISMSNRQISVLAQNGRAAHLGYMDRRLIFIMCIQEYVSVCNASTALVKQITDFKEC